MEKLEYKSRLKEMEHLVSKKKFQDAYTVANTINWRKVHNINDLIVGSEAYEAAGKLEDARELLWIAHDRSPIGRMIIYKLCMISVKLKDLEEAQELYNEFVQIAPHDSLKYILKYHISVAKNANAAALIKILEQLKEQDFLEEWAYELAYLYHKTNQADKCIDLCDEIVLWFGDGPIVERALELKMLYQPLDKSQEDKYRHLQQKKDGITEITAGEQLNSGEIVQHTMTIPSVELPAERFNTVNLQAEIKKSIDEIMKATEAGAVSENIDAIKSLVEEIPYLQVKDEAPVEEEKSDFSINDTFNDYLKEQADGQISLLLPDEAPEKEDQIEGQMTIEDVLAEWEKTKRAAEAAMEEAKSKELESARAKALREANNVLNRLEGAMSKLDAGMTSSELLKEEYLSADSSAAQITEIKIDEPDEEETSEIPSESEDTIQEEYIPSLEDLASGFAIPKLHTDGSLEGSVDIPIVKPTADIAPAVGVAIPVISKDGSDSSSWQPPTLETKEESDEVDYKEASMIIADVNKLLQKEIDRLTAESSDELTELPAEEPNFEFTIELPDTTVEAATDITVPSEEATADAAEEPALEDEAPQLAIEAEVHPLLEDLSSVLIAEVEPTEEETVPQEEPAIEEIEDETEQEIDDVVEDDFDIDLPIIELPPDLFAEDEEKPSDEELNNISIQEISIEDEPVPEVPTNPLPIISEDVLAPDELAELVDENVLSNAIKEEVPNIKLDEEDLQTFSYFLSLNGMKNNITQVLAGAAEHLDNPQLNGGNIVIIGEGGSGKTQMATSIIKVLQKKTGKPEGGIGKITGDKLNEKDILKLFSKIQGGCLIIEGAGSISKETAVTMSLLMEQDKTGTIIILEDDKRGIDKALAKDGSFGKRFTEKMVIPIFSIDELVSFAKTYAKEEGFTFDEMGVLALYNRINLIARYDHPTTIKEVAEIMDDAMYHSSKGGLFNKVKYDKDGNIILKEKDFEK